MERNLIAYPEQCPESRQTIFYPTVMCNLNDKPCILETNRECPTYEDWLFEERQEELDHPEEKEYDEWEAADYEKMLAEGT